MRISDWSSDVCSSDLVRRKVDIKSLPQEVLLMGANFTVQSYDPATGKIKADIANGFREGDYVLTTTTRTAYIPIYIPRCGTAARAVTIPISSSKAARPLSASRNVQGFPKGRSPHRMTHRLTAPAL